MADKRTMGNWSLRGKEAKSAAHTLSELEMIAIERASIDGSSKGITVGNSLGCLTEDPSEIEQEMEVGEWDEDGAVCTKTKIGPTIRRVLKGSKGKRGRALMGGRCVLPAEPCDGPLTKLIVDFPKHAYNILSVKLSHPRKLIIIIPSLPYLLHSLPFFANKPLYLHHSLLASFFFLPLALSRAPFVVFCVLS